MSGSSHAPKGITNEQLITAYRKNGLQVAETARALGCDTANVSRRIKRLAAAGEIDPTEAVHPNALGHAAQEIIDAQIELGMRSDRKKAKGDWRKPSYISGVKQSVFMLGLFGDPHLDNPGADLDLFQEELFRRNPEQGIYTACVGDFFDNWPRVMGHLYQSTGDPAPAWTMFEYWMDIAPFLFSVSGNHDQFNTGTVNFLDEFFRSRGGLLRRSGGNFLIGKGPRPIKVAMRHIWQGNSQYSEAHNLKRAAQFGIVDADLVVGGHFHKGENRTHVRAHDGRVMKLTHLSSFKRLDDYANDRGFMSPETPPVVWTVCDEREPYDSHERVQFFYDFHTARSVMEHQRGRNS